MTPSGIKTSIRRTGESVEKRKGRMLVYTSFKAGTDPDSLSPPVVHRVLYRSELSPRVCQVDHQGYQMGGRKTGWIPAIGGMNSLQPKKVVQEEGKISSPAI